MKILDFLFGKKNTFFHDELGEFVSGRIKRSNYSKYFTWIGSACLDGNAKETFIALGGNSKEPWPSHFNIILFFVENWESKYVHIFREKYENQNNTNLSFKEFNKNLYFAAINTVEETPNSSEFEFCLENSDEGIGNIVSIMVKGDDITEISFY